MDNILLVFLNDLENIKEFNEIIDKFSEENYSMYLLDNIKEDEYFNVDSLPELVEFYKSQHKSVNKVVVLSNARDLLFSWYRCYNSVVDDFIYFADKDEKNYFESKYRHYEFYNKLSKFESINKEVLMGVIFTNEELQLDDSDYKYIGNIHEFNYKEENRKKILNKKYISGGYEYIFNINKRILDSQTIDLDTNSISNKINDSLKILLFKGQSEYDVLRIMLDRVVQEFIAQGHDVTVIDLSDKECIHNINQVINLKYDFAFSFNGIGIDIKLNNGQSLLNAMDVPFVSYMVDHPVSHNDRIVVDINKVVFIFSDVENIRYMHENYPNKNSEFIPLIGVEALGKHISFENRETDVIFAGSFNNPDTIKNEWKKHDKIVQGLLLEILNCSLLSEERHLWDVVEDITNRYNNEIRSDFNLKRFLHVSVETYIRTERRYQLLKIMAESKLNILCFTNNYEELEKINKYNSLRINRQISFNELLKQMANSKIVLNISAQAYLGVSERVLSTMINGSVSLTDRNDYINDTFNNNEEILLYNKNKLEVVPHIISNALGNIKQLSDISQSGNMKVRQEYSIGKFSVKILQVYRNYFN